jgi:hydroxybutyrate-dimer hydrolase
VAVSEPQIQLKPNPALTVRRGSVVMQGSGKSLLDYATFSELYQPCAMMAPAVATSPGLAFINAARGTARCASLRAKGLLSSSTLAEQGTEALTLMQDYGYQPESVLLHPAYWAVYTHITAVHYAMAYARSSVRDNLCGFSFAPTDANGNVIPLASTALAQLFGTSSGSVTTGGINLVNNNNPGGPLLDGGSVSPSTGLVDYNIDGAICMRELVTGNSVAARQAQASIAELQVTGNLHGKPAIIVSGRSDALVPVSAASRPYFGMNKIAEGASSKLSYIEVTNANHVDIFATLGFDNILIPLAPYFNQAMDAMYNNLKSGAALPPSQLVRTVPRGGTPGAAPAITAANVPPISNTPAAANLITFSNNTVTIPD